MATSIAGILIYLRSSLLAAGKINKKLFKNESFLLGQKICLAIFALGLALSITFRQKIFIYLNSINLIYLFLFYLQPTPRTTKMILNIFILTNILLIVLVLLQL